MSRGVLACAVLGASGQFGGPPEGGCSNCFFDATALELFSSDFQVVTYEKAEDGSEEFTTAPTPSTLPTEHGSMTVDVRNFYVKLESQLQAPTPFIIGALDLSGQEIHEQIHVNGITGQASYHWEGEILNGCILVDLPPAITDQIAVFQSQMDGQLQQVESMAPQMVQQMGVPVTVDGENGVAMMNVVFSQADSHPLLVVNHVGHSVKHMLAHTLHSSPDIIKSLALKFTDYSAATGDESIRACEIESQDAMQSFLSSTPEARGYIRSRIAQHQLNLQATLQPKSLNTRFNFVPLELVELMVPVEQQCANEFVETPSQVSSVAGSVVFGIFFFSMGVAVHHGLVRQRKVALADQVSA